MIWWASLADLGPDGAAFAADDPLPSAAEAASLANVCLMLVQESYTSAAKYKDHKVQADQRFSETSATAAIVFKVDHDQVV